MLIQNDGAYIKKESPILNEANRLKAKNVYIIGGPKSVSEEISDNLKLSGLLVTRIDGRDRVEVSKNVIKENTNLNPTDTLVISDLSNFNFIQAKMGYYLKNGYAITFVQGKKFDESITKFAIDKGISNILIDQPTSIISREYDEKLNKMASRLHEMITNRSMMQIMFKTVILSILKLYLLNTKILEHLYWHRMLVYKKIT